jgi:plasmid stabilization system protein ParE
MGYKIITTTNTRKDIQQAIDWENMRDAGLGEHFLEDLAERLADISIAPSAGSLRYEHVRCTKTRIFQYLIHYAEDDIKKEILIYRVLHIKRKPTW